MNVHKLWKLMSLHEYGPEPLVIEINDGDVTLSTISMLNEGCQEGLYVTGSGKTLEEAVKNFETNLDEQILELK